MAYSTIPKGSLQMNTKLYTGNGSAGNAQTGVGFQPDFVWLKSRTSTEYQNWYDSLRGATKRLVSNLDTAETTISGLTSFNSDGFTVGAADTANQNSQNFVAWNWKGGGTGVANTDGSVATTVSANTTAGFSIVSYTGNGDTNSTFGHGLGAVPTIVITKKLTGANESWGVYAEALNSFASPANTRYLVLSNTGSYNNSSSVWNSTTPTNLHFTGGDNIANSAASMIAYCFTPIKGFSRFGSFVGNGNTNGPMVYTGFKPAFLMIKDASGSGEWLVWDNKRSPSNEMIKAIAANDSLVEDTTKEMDFLSNGFKIRTTDTNYNASSNTNIYMAFAENPFVATSGTSAIPVTAK